MKTTKNLIESSVFNLHVELPAECIEEAKKVLSKDYRRLIEVPGFRKGKAPLAAIEKKFSKNFQEDLEQTLIDSYLEQAIEEQELDLFLENPEVTEAHFHDDGSFSFSAICVTVPEIILPENFSELEVTVEKKTISKADIDEELKRLQQEHSEPDLLPLDDNFASQVGYPDATLKELRQLIREFLELDAEEEFEHNLKSAILKQLAISISCHIPERAVTAEIPRALREDIRNYHERGVSVEEQVDNLEYFKADSRQADTTALQLSLIVNAIIAREKIEVTTEDFQNHVGDLLDEEVYTIEEFEKDLKNDKTLFEKIHEQLLLEKAIDFVASQAKITELRSSKEPSFLQKTVNFLMPNKS